MLLAGLVGLIANIGLAFLVIKILNELGIE